MEKFLAISHTFDHGERPLPDLLDLCIALYILWVRCRLWACPSQMQTAQSKLDVQMSLAECLQPVCSSTRSVSPLRNAWRYQTACSLGSHVVESLINGEREIFQTLPSLLVLV